MKLADHTLHAGRFLFRWRSYVPLLFLPVFALSLVHYRSPFTTPALHAAWQLLCLLVALLGLAIRVMVVGHAPAGTSGRNQAEQKADALNTTGMYAVVRHPLYLANGLMFLGLALLPGVWYLPVIVLLGTMLYYERIMLVEEAFIEEKYGDSFRAWAARTPAIVPAWSCWVPPRLPFSWRTALRGEIYAGFAIVAAVFVVDLLEAWLATGTLRLSPVWTPPFVVLAVAWQAIRILKKTTQLLSVDGR